MNFGINLSFTVKRWVEPQVWAKIVRETGGVDQVGVAPERRTQLAADLRALQ